MKRKHILSFFLMTTVLVMGSSIIYNFGVPDENSRFEKASLANNENSNVIPAQLGTANYTGSFQVLPDPNPPVLSDPNLRVEKVIAGLQSPTSMQFVDDNDIIILQKNDGMVRLVSNGVLQPQPILQVPVANESERGLLGVTIANTTELIKTVFLYYTEPDGDHIKNRVYKYEWNGTGNITGGTLILDLPGEPGPNHNGGKIKIGPDDMLYGIIGDLNRDGMLQNVREGLLPDDTSVIFRVDHNGNGTGNPLSGGGANITKYYAYGIRNAFGFDFDPLTGILWDAENGPADYDEINIVLPGFNSGWNKVMGPIERTERTIEDLVHFNGSHYSNPVFSWLDSRGVTDLEILNSTRLGERYSYNMFVGAYGTGNLYFFTINSNRTGLDFSGMPGLEDLVADSPEEENTITFGTGFGPITHLETGPDGYLYILTLAGDLYRIVPGVPATGVPAPPL